MPREIKEEPMVHRQRRVRWLPILLGLMLLASMPARGDQPRTDMQITDAVELEMTLDPAVPSHRLAFDTRDGVLTMTGVVDNLLAKERAARVAETVRGVRSVVNRIVVRPLTNRSDEAIRKDVIRALLDNPATDSYEIGVHSQDGELTLTGTVDSWQERELSATVAKGVRGVTGVVNRIAVEPVTVQRPDLEIQQDVQETLRWNPLVDQEFLDVDVQDGEVRLRGTVGSLAELTEATMDCWTVAGVESVLDDDVSVEPWARDADRRMTSSLTVTDREVRTALEAALERDPRVSDSAITLRVDDGLVTLRGTVAYLGARRAAAQDARNTVGVTRVRNNLKVDRREGPDDALIESQIQQALRRDPYVAHYDLGVEVQGGTAILTGTADSYFEKAQADVDASQVYGVLDVANDITVNRKQPLPYQSHVDEWYVYDFDWYNHAPGHTFRPDFEIQEDIVNQLWWSPFVDAADVTVEVDDGVATLTGTVDSWSEYWAARENALEGGAVWVDNELHVAASG